MIYRAGYGYTFPFYLNDCISLEIFAAVKAMPNFFIKDFWKLTIEKLAKKCFSAGICDTGV